MSAHRAISDVPRHRAGMVARAAIAGVLGAAYPSLLTACQSTPEPAVPSEAFRRVIASFCTYAVDCANRPAGFTFDTQSECQTIMLNSIGGSVAMGQYDTAAENGRVIWSNDDAEYCADLAAAWSATATCQELWATRITLNFSDPRCDALGEGTVVQGGACAVSLECADDNSCRSGACAP